MSQAAQAETARVMRRRVADVLATPDRSPWTERPAVKAAIVLLWLYGSALALALGQWTGWLTGGLAVSLGLAVGCGLLSVGHSGTHRTTFGGGRASRLVAQLGSFGITAAWWRAQHNIAHHGGVPDGGRAGERALDLGPFARLSADQPWRPWHRAQPVYFYGAFLLQHIGLIGGNLVYSVTGQVDRHRVADPTTGHRVRQCSAQFGVPAALVALALTRHGPLGTLTVVAVAVACSGLAMSLVLAVEVAHRGRAPLPTDGGSAGWAQWQADVSMTISTPHPLAVWFAGGLNFHTEHHFFPKAPMHRLGEIQPVVRATCLEYGLPYHEYPGFVASWRELHRHLVSLSRPPAAPTATIRA